MGAPARWSHAAWAHSLSHQYAHEDETLFDGVRQVRPRTILSVGPGGRTSEIEAASTAWPRIGNPGDFFAGSFKEAAAETRRLAEEAVRLRMDSEASLACHLSGGIDSTLIAALAMGSGSWPGGPKAFAVSFQNGPHDEGPAAAAAAAALGIPLEIVEAPPGRLFDRFDEAAASGESLAINAHLSAKLLLNEALAADGRRVALTGEGADELFSGYPHLREDLLFYEGDAGGVSRLHEEQTLLRGTFLSAGDGGTEGGPFGARPPGWLAAKIGMGRLMRRHCGSEALSLLDSACGEGGALGDLRRRLDFDKNLAGRHPVDSASWSWCRTALCGYILRALGDGMEMARSVEGRTPFLDPVLASFAATLPVSMRIRGGVEKAVLREAAKGLVPENVRVKRKHPFVAPGLCADPDTRLRIVERLRDGSFDGRTPFDGDSLASAIESAAEDADALRMLEPAATTALAAWSLGRAYGLSFPSIRPKKKAGRGFGAAWAEELFDSDYADHAMARTWTEALEIAARILSLAGGGVGAVFDQCCGTGTVSLALAEAGLRVFGLDASSGYIGRAEAEARSRGLDCAFEAGDAAVRTAPFPCDLAVNWHSSFGYGVDEEEDCAFLARAFESLQVGGVFLLETMNLPFVLSDHKAEWSRTRPGPNGDVVLRRRSALSDGGRRMEQEWTWIEGGREKVRRTALRLYMPHEIASGLRRTGFSGVRLLGSDGSPWTPEAERLIVLARRGAD